ncbi:unnamed protein product, partial [Didymodactylos carnosus]
MATCNDYFTAKANRSENFEPFTLLYDTSISAQDESQTIQIKLRNLINYLKPFESIEQCQRYIQQFDNEKIVLIVSDGLGHVVIPQTHDLKQINSIYIYSENKQIHKTWMKQFKK